MSGKKKKNRVGKRIGNTVTAIKVWVAGVAADIFITLGLSPKYGPFDEQPSEQLSEQSSLDNGQSDNEQLGRRSHVATAIPTIRKPLSQGGGYSGGSAYHVDTRFDDPSRDKDFGRIVPRSTYGAILVPPEHGHGTYYHCCDSLYGSAELLSPEPIEALGEQRRVPVVIEYLNSIPACYPHTGLRRDFLLIRVKRGAKRVYRLLLPVGVACRPVVEQSSLGDSAEFFSSDELVAIGKKQALELTKLEKGEVE